MTAVQSATINLSPVNANAQAGHQLTLNVLGNFDAQSVLAGATDITWDAGILRFADFAFGAAFAVPVRDPTFDPKHTPGSAEVFDLQSSSLVTVGFGNFAGIAVANAVIGTLTFDVIGAAGASTAIELADSVKWEGYFDIASNAIGVSYAGAVAEVASPVPVPAAGWLLTGALGSLCGALKRSRKPPMVLPSDISRKPA